MNIELKNLVGMRVNIDVKDISEAYATMKKYGSNGWTSSADIPSGGYKLPYCMADTFDWSLIGAKTFKSKDEEECVFHGGYIYKKRDYAAETGGQKKGAAIKYSRGAVPTDPPHIVEGDPSKPQYVTLIKFSGKGQPIKALAK